MFFCLIPSPTVKLFYFCTPITHGFNMNRKPLKTVQKQTCFTSKNSPTGKKKFSNWEKIIFLLGNNIFPTGHFRLSSWISTELWFCKEFWWHTDYFFLTEEHKNIFFLLLVSDKIISTVYRSTYLLPGNQKVVLSFGRNKKKWYFCNNYSL